MVDDKKVPLDIVELHDLITQSEAWQVNNRLRRFKEFFYAFDRNFEDLQKFLAQYENKGSASPESWLKLRNDGVQETLYEVSRLLLNFLASAKALIDRTRTFMASHYKSEPIHESYKAQIEVRFKENNLGGFIQDLRNYTLHHGIPYSGAHWHFRSATETKDAEFHNYISLDREALLTSGYEWKLKAKEYLEQVENSLTIRKITQEYYSQVWRFQAWLEHELHNRHKNELDWLEEKIVKYDEAAAPLRRAMAEAVKNSPI